MQRQTIPIFPLSIVVFPGHLVPLHIFEDRYKKMIDDCTDAGGRNTPFGISYDNDGDIAGVGCTLVVVRREDPGADGSFDIVCRAGSRYRTTQLIEDGPYLLAEVEYFADDEADEADPALQGLVKSRFGTLVDLAAKEAGTQIIDGRDTADAAKQLQEGDAWAIAQRLGLEGERRQQLLVMRSENARLQNLAEYLEDLLPILEERMERKTRVKSNGHTPHA